MLKPLTVRTEGLSCDVCQDPFQKAIIAMSCRGCNYDLCGGCWEKAKGGEQQAAPAGAGPAATGGEAAGGGVGGAGALAVLDPLPEERRILERVPIRFHPRHGSFTFSLKRGKKLIFFSTTVKAANGKEAAERISKLCLLLIGTGKSKDEAVAYRNKLYARMHGIAEEPEDVREDLKIKDDLTNKTGRQLCDIWARLVGRPKGTGSCGLNKLRLRAEIRRLRAGGAERELRPFYPKRKSEQGGAAKKKKGAAGARKMKKKAELPPGLAKKMREKARLRLQPAACELEATTSSAPQAAPETPTAPRRKAPAAAGAGETPEQKTKQPRPAPAASSSSK